MTLQTALQELAEMIKEEIIARLHSNIGVNPRVGRNTLIGSNLERSIDVKQTAENAIVFEIADYYEYVVRGWKRTYRFPNTSHLFIRNITAWVREKNIRLGNMTQTEIVYYLYKRMLIEGREIAPRPFISYDEGGDPSKILPFLDKMMDNWSEMVFQLITEDLSKIFNK